MSDFKETFKSHAKRLNTDTQNLADYCSLVEHLLNPVIRTYHLDTIDQKLSRIKTILEEMRLKIND